MYDVVINNGRYFDGTGAPSSIKSIAVVDGKIKALSDEAFDPSSAIKSIDATGQWISPGFIDSHVHLKGIGKRQRIPDLINCKTKENCLKTLKNYQKPPK